jgi:cell division protein FtsB
LDANGCYSSRVHASSRVADFLARVVVITVVVAGVVAVFVWYFPLIQKNQNLRREIATQEARLSSLQQEITSMSRQLELFVGNSNTVERLLRENLGYSRPGETVVRFEEKSPGAMPAPGR